MKEVILGIAAAIIFIFAGLIAAISLFGVVIWYGTWLFKALGL